MVKVYTLALAAGAKRLSDVFGGSAGVVDEAKNIPFRQVLFTTAGADAYLGDSTVSTANGVKVASAGVMPVSLGPFPSGPLKLSDFYAVGAGATLSVLGVPF